jgi:2-polyprenyl-6-methoxyphenol hydroxylase-like FAD-dependent oxidoreductase
MKVIVVGGGIGGLTVALSCHQAGIPVRVFESVKELSTVGAGINLQPNGVRELDELGLGARLAATGIPTANWSVYNKHGQLIWSEPRGLAAGYRWPQYSIHRGQLQKLLFDAALERLGAQNVLTGHHLASFEQDESGVTARFIDRRTGDTLATERGDVLVGADGIHSVVRAFFYPSEGRPRYSGEMQWRASVEAAPFLDGKTQLIVGHRSQRFLAYPMSVEAASRGRSLVNWIAELRMPENPVPPDWDRRVAKEAFWAPFTGWKFPWLDVPALIASTPVIFEFPKVDRDPVKRWSFGRVTLVGDAAHPMLPTGSQAGSQAVVSARVLVRELMNAPATQAGIEAALKAYEKDRLEPMANITLQNRELGPEAAMQLAEERAPNGFERVEDVIPSEEMAAITEGYKKKAGLDSKTVNERPSFVTARANR